MQSTYLDVAYIVLQQAGKPMTPMQIIDTALREGLLRDNRRGKTPRQTLNSKLSVHVRDEGENSIFIRTSAGHYDIRRLDEQAIYHSPPRKPRNTDEQVLVFPTVWLDAHGRFQGISSNWHALTKLMFSAAPWSYLDRISAEQTEDYKQVITYVLVTMGEKVLAYKRGTFNRVEDYLKGCQCVGFGGHVKDSDLTILDSDHMGVYQCAARELAEELRLPDYDANRLLRGEGLEIVGIINDDSSSTGRRHIALVMRYKVEENMAWQSIKAREQSITQLRWLDLNQHNFPLWDFEYWSQLCLRQFYSGVLLVQPAYRIRQHHHLKAPHLLCVLGQVGSGKSEITHVLHQQCGYAEINTGRVLAELMNLPPVTEETRAVFQKEAWKFITSHDGPDKLAQAIWLKVKEQTNTKILIDGVRQQATLDCLKQYAGTWDVGLIYVYTPPDMAYEFYRMRDKNLSIYDFLEVRDADVEQDTTAMLEKADAVVYNWAGLEKLQETVVKLMSQFD